jgi:CelD/BcsL family acetyltransferase involved in cellulose biosynthesis
VTREPRLLVLSDLGRWAPQWDGLVDQSPLPSPFQRSWWLIGAGGTRICFLLVVDDDRLLGGVALEQGRRLGLPCFRMLSAGPLCPDHLDLLARPGDEDVVVRVVGDWLRRPGARLFDLEGIRADSRLISALPDQVRREFLAVAPWVAVPADFEDYRAARSANFRRNLRRASARLAAEGATRRIERGGSAIRSLEAFRQLHSAQWGDRSHFLPSFERFAAACRLAAEVDEVAFHELTVGETVITIFVTFEVARRVSLYQSARQTDDRWRDGATVLLAAVITDACNRGLAEVDFLRGDEEYKSGYAPLERELFRLRAANGRAGRVALVVDTAVRKSRGLVGRLRSGAAPRRRAGQPGPAGRSLEAAGPPVHAPA